MRFPVSLYVLAFAGAATTSLATLPLWRKWAFSKGLVDDPGHRKIHEQSIPLAGGLTMFGALLIPALIAIAVLWLKNPGFVPTGVVTDATAPSQPRALDFQTAQLLAYGLRKRWLQLATILVGAFGMLLVGLLDDKRELRPGAKFAGQFAVAFLVAAAGVRVTLFIPNVLFSYAITIFWILTVVNAFNFMDNMNGLCAGLGVIGALYLAAAAALAGQYLVALIAFVTAGALAGFLPYNFPRAQTFLGDSGSHLTGYLLAVMAILPHFYTAKHPHAWAVLKPLLVLAVPLGDLIWVVLLRWRMGKPFYIGDTNHLSHRLVRRGFSQTQSVLLIWVIGIVAGALALL